MKRFPILLLAAAGCFAVTSCSQDDGTSLSADLTGTYEIRSMIIDDAQDYDNDSDSSTNLALEGTCNNDSWISFHDNGTYDEGYSATITSPNGVTLTCVTEVTSGTYIKNGTTVTTTSSTGTELVKTYEFDLGSHTLSRTAENKPYVMWSAGWITVSGDIDFTYKKYTDNDTDNGQNDDDDDNLD